MASLIHYMTTAETQEDLEIAAGLRRRDPDLLDHLIEQYQYRLLRYLVTLTGDLSLAEDLFQDTWLRVLERGDRYDGRARFVAWLLTVARNLAIDALRKRRAVSLDALVSNRDQAPLEPVASAPGPYELLSSREQGERLSVFVSCLPAHYREVLVLRFQEDLALEEIARITDAPLSTVKSRLGRGLRALAPRLEVS